MKIKPEGRENYRHFLDIPTRWHDNDVYHHVNNVVYYSFFDTVVNKYLITSGVLRIKDSKLIGLVIETKCNFFSPVEFPDMVTAGLRVGHLGNSSVIYEVGLFVGDNKLASAQGHFVHVYVDRQTRKPKPMGIKMRHVLEKIAK